MNALNIIQIVKVFSIVEMGKKTRDDRVFTEMSKPGKSRKDLRKEKKQEKKQRIRKHHKNASQTPLQHNQIMKKNITPQKSINNRKQQKIVQKKVSKKVKAIQKNQDDHMIEMCQKKLGLKQGKDSYHKMAKKYGFDDDIFDFLDGISKKVNNEKMVENEQYNKQELDIEQQIGSQQEMEEEENQQGDQQEGQNQQFDDQFDQMFENLGQNPQMQFDQQGEELQQQQEGQEQEQQIQNQQEEQNEDHQNQMNQQQFEEKPIPATKTNFSVFRRQGPAQTQINPSQRQVRRSMNALLNKLSDGNILLTFREFMRIIESHPRSLTIPIYSELFTRFNLLIQKPLFHILASNAALAAGLHYAFGNRLMGPLIHNLTCKFLQISNSKQDQQQVQQFGYSKRFQRLKNYAVIISLFYSYGSITAQFLQSFVQWLTLRLDRYHIQLLFIIVQKCGMRIRQNDPSTLKGMISVIKEGIDGYKKRNLNSGEEMQKVNFIELELSEIKFNKKAQFDPDQRMAFLQTFITKNVPKQVESQREVFPVKFEELQNADVSQTNWWLQQNEKYDDQEAGGVKNEQIAEMGKQRVRLLELARAFHLVTQVKKNIFVSLMDSKDYLQATQKILQLKVRNLQDIGTVLVQVCTLQPTFNPFYPLVASKLANLLPKFRLHLQYAIWDHIKLVPTYQLRRVANLAKFTARLISNPMSNCSLSLLKFYPDLSNLPTHDVTFLNVFFGHFFSKVKREYLSKLVHKLREDNNRIVKEGIKEFLADYQPEQKVREKYQLCRRLLMLELDERKAERSDED